MNDPYKKVFDDIVKAFNKHFKMIDYLAQHTLTAKEYIEFANEFSTKTDTNKDSVAELMKEAKEKS